MGRGAEEEGSKTLGLLKRRVRIENKEEVKAGEKERILKRLKKRRERVLAMINDPESDPEFAKRVTDIVERGVEGRRRHMLESYNDPPWVERKLLGEKQYREGIARRTVLELLKKEAFKLQLQIDDVENKDRSLERRRQMREARRQSEKRKAG